MKRSTLKLMVAILVFILLLANTTSILATNDETMQILKKADKEYMIYLKNHLGVSFEFAFSNDKNANKETLGYKNAATDTAEAGANYIAYIDEDLYNTYFTQPTYLWARTLGGNYFIEGIEVKIAEALTDNEVDLANHITKTIAVDTTQTFDKPAEMIEGVKTTKTVGKVTVQEEGTTDYQLIKVPKNGSYYEFMKLAEKIANNKIENNIYAELEVAKEFSKLYQELMPEVNNANWVTVENNEILQPEEAKEGEQYILWLKNKQGNDVKLDAQFLTCFEDYKPEVISEKVVTKLPVTADDPTLFIILAILIVALVVVGIVKITAGKKEKVTKKASKH